MPKDNYRIIRAVRLKIAIITLFMLIAASLPQGRPAAQEDDFLWGDYVNISQTGDVIQVTEPKITGDDFGNVHVVWTAREDGGQVVYYMRYDNRWRVPIDIVAQENALAAAITADDQGYLHIIWMGANELFYSRAFSGDALSAGGWEPPQYIGGNAASGSPFAADILVDDQGVLHVVYGDNQSANVYAIRSSDGGSSWTDPQAIREVGPIDVDEAATEIRTASDSDTGELHVVWTARKIPEGWPGTRLFYSRSNDQGATWAEPLTLDNFAADEYDEDRGPFFPSIAVRDREELHVTWSGAPRGERWHQWSLDGGKTWSAKTAVEAFNETSPGAGLPGTTGFTDMIVDSAGQLYAVTKIGESGAPRIARWLDGIWGARTDSPYPGTACEDPRLALTEGNKIHLVCVEQSGSEPNDIWYVPAQTNAPPLPVSPLPAEDEIVAAIEAPEAETATLGQTPGQTAESPPVSFDTEPTQATATGLPLLAIVMIPSLLIVLAVILYQAARRRRR